MQVFNPVQKVSLAIATTLCVVTPTIGYIKIGWPPVIIVGGSAAIGFIFWYFTYLKNPTDPKVILPVFILTVAGLQIHMIEEYVTGFGPAMSRVFNIPWTEISFLMTFMMIGPVVYTFTTLGLYYRVPIAGFIAWFIFIGPGVVEFTHFRFPLIEPHFEPSNIHRITQTIHGVEVANMPNFYYKATGHFYFSAMSTAILPMIPGSYAIYRLVKESRLQTKKAQNGTAINHRQSASRFQKISLVEPSKSWYLHISAEIDHSPFPFFLSISKKKKRLIAQAKNWCLQAEKEVDVISAVVFKASIIPPSKGKFLQERLDTVQLAKYDFAVLIEAASADAIERIVNSDAYKEIEAAVKKISFLTHVVTATNVKRINSVNHREQGVFLFNYFFADSLQQNLDVWEYTAGWFQQETGLDNSTVLLPTNGQASKYTIINHCRWDKLRDVLPALLFKQSFHSYVLDNFYANKVAAIPVLYKIA